MAANVPAQAAFVRRIQVKAAVAKGKTVKSKTVVKTGGNVAGKVAGKAAAKPAPKPTAKPAPRPAAKTASPKSGNKAVKPVAKPVARPVAKPAAKVTVKPVVKPAAKAAVKAVKKQVAKPVAKTSHAKAPASKAPASVKTNKVNVVIPKSKPAGAKPVAKSVAKPITKLVDKPAPKVAVKPLATATAAPLAVASTPVGAYPAVPQKTGRPSSRLAQLTVPSMAQSVASTAAKSSFTQSTALPLITPPLASAVKKDPKLANNWKSKTAEQLSDSELIAMPDAEYMNDKQMQAFRLKLLTLRQDILDSAGLTTEHLREDTVVVPDPADRATIEEEHALELRTRDRERKLLKKIEQSINRIDLGDYGYCDETGEPIGVGRLIARPTATLSLEAQQRRELKQKMFGD